ncbi:MAG: ATP-binding protein [Brevundimonas sp.]|uniref:ATP-binding protein n=1 Tax=Brevundimonas sp. TaxID=1871086 RepID=UPI004033B965
MAGWAQTNARRLLALTVDHGLHSDSVAWTARAGEHARGLGADWQALRWTDDKPATGMQAAARTARHALIAEAARAAGARVVLFAHTADDIAEADLMRAEGSTLGQLREWSPSPVWPEGRGFMLLRPLLHAGRTELRDWLTGQGADWIDDPANTDPRHTRSRARARLCGARAAPVEPGPAHGVLAVGDDLIRLGRDVSARAMSAALVCAGGGDRPPRGDRLDVLLSRLRSGEIFTATACGSRLVATGEAVLVMREPGEFRRADAHDVVLRPDSETVWDGRWALVAPSPGWSVGPAAGRLMRLSDAEGQALRALPPPARAARPVLLRDGGAAPVLAGEAAKARCLVGERLGLALDRMTHERDLGLAMHGATPWNHLFSGADITK